MLEMDGVRCCYMYLMMSLYDDAVLSHQSLAYKCGKEKS